MKNTMEIKRSENLEILFLIMPDWSDLSWFYCKKLANFLFWKSKTIIF